MGRVRPEEEEERKKENLFIKHFLFTLSRLFMVPRGGSMNERTNERTNMTDNLKGEIPSAIEEEEVGCVFPFLYPDECYVLR